MDDYGKELILDLHGCNPDRFNRRDLANFFRLLCIRIDMIPEELHFWDYKDEEEEKEKDPDHLVGTSAIQFIRTSNITIHTLDRLARVYLNVFSCKDFDEVEIVNFAKWFFAVAGEVEVANKKIIRRI